MTDIIPIQTEWAPNRAGFFRMPAQQYFDAPGVSQSMLKQIAKSPAHLKAYLEEDDSDTPTRIFGRLTHLALFEPKLLINGVSHWVKPDGMKFNTVEGKAWKAERMDGAPLPIISSEDALDLAGIERAALRHPLAGGLLACPGVAEVSAFSCDKWASGLSLTRRIRLDRIVRADDGRKFIIDAKTTSGDWSDASPKGFQREIEKFGYYRQAAYYIDVCESLGVEIEDFLWIAVERKPPYAVGIYNLSDEDIDVGRRLYQRELALYAQCLESGEWPGYETGIVTLALHKWVREAV